MKDFLASLVIAVSFFTVFPLPRIEWTSCRMKFLPILMPLVGFGIGLLGYSFLSLLVKLGISVFSSSVLMALFYLVITGGLHMDGLMDTADAYFSRQSQERKLEIMKDSRVGPFAVMTLVSLLLVKTACFYEIVETKQDVAALLCLIPVLSRIGQAFILCSFPCARKDGLAVIFKEATGPITYLLLGVYLVLSTCLILILVGFKALFLPAVLLLFTFFYYFSTQKNFGGITGDIVGAYVELAELIMLLLLVVIGHRP